MELKTLYEYYERQDIAPTFADLRDEASLAAYQSAREALFADRLRLPVPLFRGAEVLEFGPDTGENAVVFARWGATMTLVEPALAAHPRIRAYFERYAPPGSLRELARDDVLGFVPTRRYDVIIAEGFVYTVRPTRAWLDAFRRALVPGGVALVSYVERSGSLFELSLKVPFATLRRQSDEDRVAVAQRLYRPKWDRIPHTRAFESWTMDVLDNPFVRLAYCLGAAELLCEADDAGFALHESWPSYRDGLESGWHKRIPTSTERRERDSAHLRRSVLSFALGTKAYLVDDREAARIEDLLDAALADTDALIDADDADRSRRLAGTLREVAMAVRAARLLVDDRAAIGAGIALLDAWAGVHESLAEGAFDEAIRRLRGDAALLDGWGTPTHLALLRA